MVGDLTLVCAQMYACIYVDTFKDWIPDFKDWIAFFLFLNRVLFCKRPNVISPGVITRFKNILTRFKITDLVVKITENRCELSKRFCLLIDSGFKVLKAVHIAIPVILCVKS